LGTAATTGLLYQPQMIGDDVVEKLMEWRLAGEIKVLGKNLSQRHFVHHKSHMTRPDFEPGPPRWEASDYKFFYFFFILVCEASSGDSEDDCGEADGM
jgi:hypothetical protein